MGRGKKTRTSDTSHSTADSSSDLSKESTQLWAALKKDDAEKLATILLQDSAEEHRRRPTLNARALLSQCNTKKLLPLTFAVSEGLSEETITVLLTASAPVNMRDETHSTALHAAAWNDDDSSIRLLLSHGADPRVVDGEGRSLLHVLASSTAPMLLEYVLEFVASPITNHDDTSVPYGAKPVKLDPLQLLCQGDQKGLTPIHTAFSDAPFGKPQAASAILRLMNEWKASGEYPAERLLQTLHVPSRDLSTPLHLLFQSPNGDVREISKLMDSMASLGAISCAVNREGDTPLHMAVVSVGEDTGYANVQTNVFLLLLRSFPSIPDLVLALTEANRTTGERWVHLVILERCTAALVALETYLQSVAPEEKQSVVACLGRDTMDGLTVADLLACELAAEGSSSLTKIVSCLCRLGVVVEKDIEALTAEKREIVEEALELQRTEALSSSPAAAQSSSSIQAAKGALNGASRAQLARKSRAIRQHQKEKEKKDKLLEAEESHDDKEEVSQKNAAASAPAKRHAQKSLSEVPSLAERDEQALERKEEGSSFTSVMLVVLIAAVAMLLVYGSSK